MSNLRGLLFTSIPKAGKNVIYSFFGELGYTRMPLERDLALGASEEPWLRQSLRSETYARPAQTARDPVLPDGLKTFVDAVSVIGQRQIVHHHFAFSAALANPLRALGVPIVFVYRDPRDVLVSMADYIINQRKPDHLAHKFRELERAALVERLWTGDEELVSLPTYFRMFADWRGTPGVIAAKFESLIGEKGGGSVRAQREIFAMITSVLGDVPAADFERACRAAFNPGAGTYYKGRAGRWQDETDSTVAAILGGNEMTQLAAEWGYERRKSVAHV